MRLRADFNGLFGEILCLSHSDTCVDETGATVDLHAGMVVTAFDEDVDDNGKRDDLLATGVVEPSPDWLRCNGSKWALRIDANGVRHESDVAKDVDGAPSPCPACGLTFEAPNSADPGFPRCPRCGYTRVHDDPDLSCPHCGGWLYDAILKKAKTGEMVCAYCRKALPEQP